MRDPKITLLKSIYVDIERELRDIAYENDLIGVKSADMYRYLPDGPAKNQVKILLVKKLEVLQEMKPLYESYIKELASQEVVDLNEFRKARKLIG